MLPTGPRASTGPDVQVLGVQAHLCLRGLLEHRNSYCGRVNTAPLFVTRNTLPSVPTCLSSKRCLCFLAARTEQQEAGTFS